MNWDIVGHEWAVDLLQAHVAHEQVRHAYLFTGPPGVGRMTLALRFAQALNCLQPLAPGLPCRICRTCQQIERRQYADLEILEPEQEGKDIKIEAVRALQHRLSLSPYQGRYKIALLCDFQRATLSAQNAMLKTLEEAPTRVVLLLTAFTPEDLLPTIMSRCEVLRMRPLPIQKVESLLAGPYKVEPGRARLLAHLSGGRVGYALNLNAAPDVVEKYQAVRDQVFSLLAGNRRQRFAYAEMLVGNKRDRNKSREALRETLSVWLTFWRDALLCASGAQLPLSNIDRQDLIRVVAGRLALPVVRRVVEGLEKAQAGLEANLNLLLLTEVTLLDWPYLNLSDLPAWAPL